jgi:ketosteroid isomerase-like protein
MKARRLIPLTIASLAWVFLGGCAKQPQTQIEPLSKQTTQDFANLMQSRGYDKLSTMFTEDAKMMPPDAPVIEGRKAILDFLQDSSSQQSLPTEVDEREQIAAGDYTYRYGFVTQHLLDGSTQTGKFVQLWKNVDGTWKLHRTMWNLSGVTKH